MLFKTSNKKTNITLVVSGLFILLLSLFTYLFFECQNWIGANAGQAITTSNYFITGTVLLAFDICFLLFSIKYFKVSLRLPFLVIAVVGVIFGMITLLGFPGAIYNGEIVYVPSKIEILKGVFTTILVFFAMYLYAAIVPQVVKGRKYYKIYYIIGACVGLYGIIHSYVFESDVYQVLFTNPHAYSQVPQSFTTNRNVYAFILVISMLCEAYLIVDDGMIWHWPLMFFFFFNVLFTFSKTAIIIAVIALFMFITWMVVRLLNSHPWRAFIIAFSTVILGIIFLIVSEVNFKGFLGYGHTFLKYLIEELPKFSENAFESRIYWFRVALNQLNRHPFTRIFGFGYVNWIPSFYAAHSGDYTKYQPMDVAYAIDMFQMGFPGLIIAGILWIYVIYNIQMLFVRKSKYAFVGLLFFVPIILRTVTEGGDLAYTNLSGVAYYVLLLCPMISERKAYIVDQKLNENPALCLKTANTTAKVIASLVGLIATIVSSMLLSFAFVDKSADNSALFVWSIIVMISGTTLSILIHLFLFSKTRRTAYLLATILFALTMVALSFGGRDLLGVAALVSALALIATVNMLLFKDKKSVVIHAVYGLLPSLLIWLVGVILLSIFAGSLDGMASLIVILGSLIVGAFAFVILKKEVFLTLFHKKKMKNAPL